MKQIIGTRFLALVLCWFMATVAQANGLGIIVPNSPPVSSTAYVLMDFYSGQVLAEKESETRVEPASLTKIMTMYVIDHELSSGRIHPEDLVMISEKAWKAEGARMFVEVNTRVSVADLIRGIIIQSGNDASIAMAEYIAGSEEAFVAMMNQHAKRLGMKNTHFVNVTGIPAKDHYSSAMDLARLSQAIIRDFPENYSLYSEKWFSYNGIKQPNRNRLLWRNDHVDGIKTGHTDSAGYCLVSSAAKDEMRLISVVLGSQDDGARTDGSNKLLTYGFRFFETHRLFAAFKPLKQARVWMGDNPELSLGTTDDIFVTIPQGYYDELTATIRLDNNIRAPIAEGDAYGIIEVTLGDEVLATKPLVSLHNVAKGGVFRRFRDYVSMTFSSSKS
jgi:D-alanyl-D-alanine carboxypeptidase (penicillin-binding protein 5/6)